MLQVVGLLKHGNSVLATDDYTLHLIDLWNGITWMEPEENDLLSPHPHDTQYAMITQTSLCSRKYVVPRTDFTLE